MDFQQLFLSPQGRLNRQPFWLVWVAMSALQIAVELIFASELANIVVALLLLWPGLVIAIKRCHDRDRPGWWLLIGLIPVAGGLWLLVELGFLRGTPGPNRFGPDPLADQNAPIAA
jgi:uncharacterized membrane protein YhaH (DUF805 family)